MYKPRALNRHGTRITALVLTIGLLAGCEEAPQLAFLQPGEKATGAGEDGSVSRSSRVVERDVEAPEVFQVTEAGLWDGRPSLGGVWVAHPEVTEPERVIIRNEANGQFVIGALFKREREIPGPRLQTSSDAASALGMLAGAPVKLNVTALKREAEEAEEPVEPEARTAALPQSEEIAETALEPIAGAAAAIEASEKSDATAPEAQASAQPTVQSDVVNEKPRRGLFAGLFKPRNQPADEGVELASAAPSPILSDELPPAATGTAAPEPAAAAAPAPRPSTSSLDKPYIQIGIFSVEANAERTAKQMRGAGMVPTVRKAELQGKPFWRVLVGPATDTSERATLLKRIKTQGFSDAYAVDN